MHARPRPLGNPSPTLPKIPRPPQPHGHLQIAHRSVKLPGKLSADLLNVDFDGVQLHSPKPPGKPRKKCSRVSTSIDEKMTSSTFFTIPIPKTINMSTGPPPSFPHCRASSSYESNR